MSTIRSRLARLQQPGPDGRPIRVLTQRVDGDARRPSDEDLAEAIAAAEAEGYRPHVVIVNIVRAPAHATPA